MRMLTKWSGLGLVEYMAFRDQNDWFSPGLVTGLERGEFLFLICKSRRWGLLGLAEVD